MQSAKVCCKFTFIFYMWDLIQITSMNITTTPYCCIKCTESLLPNYYHVQIMLNSTRNSIFHYRKNRNRRTQWDMLIDHKEVSKIQIDTHTSNHYLRVTEILKHSLSFIYTMKDGKVWHPTTYHRYQKKMYFNIKIRYFIISRVPYYIKLRTILWLITSLCFFVKISATSIQNIYNDIGKNNNDNCFLSILSYRSLSLTTLLFSFFLSIILFFDFIELYFIVSKLVFSLPFFSFHQLMVYSHHHLIIDLVIYNL